MVTGVALGLTAVALFTPKGLARMFLEQNFQSVVPGIYRSAQPTRDDLERWTEAYGLRSILNLRRTRDGVPWWETEQAFTREHGLEHRTVKLNADRLPPTSRLDALIDAIDHAPRPLLIHCEGGIERSGLAGAVAVLLHGGSPSEARHHFDRSRGFIEWAAFSDLPHVVDDYAAWLDAEGREHRPDTFRYWAREVYVPYFYRVELVDAGRDGDRIAVRVTNRSPQPIVLRADAPPGVRLGAHWIPRRSGCGAVERIELRGEAVDGELGPGESTTLHLRRPADPRPGRLVVDLVDEAVDWFADMGSPPLELELPARHP